jgi:type IV secretory pathway VirB10-like protein
MKNARLARFASGLVFCLLADGAFAQYVWLDEKGVKQFSDMPPPASVPAKRILKQPGGTAVKAVPEASDQAPDASAKPAAAPKEPLTAAEQNAEFRKRRAEQAEKEKKTAEQAKLAAAKATNCERTRAYQGSLASGERISRTDANGERVYMSDEQREREMQEAQRMLADCK